jgi:hypothetical protein
MTSLQRSAVVVVFLAALLTGYALVPIEAQPGPPRTYTCQWTHDPAGGAADSFEVLVDGTVAATLAASACVIGTPLRCESPLTMTTNVPHTVFVRAVNIFGQATSDPFSAAPPGRPAGVVIR